MESEGVNLLRGISPHGFIDPHAKTQLTMYDYVSTLVAILGELQGTDYSEHIIGGLAMATTHLAWSPVTEYLPLGQSAGKSICDVFFLQILMKTDIPKIIGEFSHKYHENIDVSRAMVIISKHPFVYIAPFPMLCAPKLMMLLGDGMTYGLITEDVKRRCIASVDYTSYGPNPSPPPIRDMPYLFYRLCIQNRECAEIITNLSIQLSEQVYNSPYYIGMHYLMRKLLLPMLDDHTLTFDKLISPEYRSDERLWEKVRIYYEHSPELLRDLEDARLGHITFDLIPTNTSPTSGTIIKSGITLKLDYVDPLLIDIGLEYYSQTIDPGSELERKINRIKSKYAIAYDLVIKRL